MDDLARVRDVFESLRSFYAGVHAQMTRQDFIYDKRFDSIVRIPFDIKVFPSSTGSNIVDGFRNQLRTDKPTVDFRPYSRSDVADKHSLFMQRWGYRQLMMERERGIVDPTLQCGFDLLLRGACCKKIVVDVDAMAGMPPKKGSKKYDMWEEKAMHSWPFVTRAIDPLSIFPSPEDRRPLSYLIEKQRRTAGQIRADYPSWTDPDTRRNPAREVEWLEYWDAEHYVVEVDGEELFRRENPYGFVPYIFEWSGMGRAHSDNDPSHLAHGVLTSVMGEIEREASLKTAISVQTEMHIFPPILTTDDPQTVAQQFGVGPGKVIQHAPGQPPVYMEFPPPNENLYRFLNTIQENIARIHSKSLSGGRESGVDYGVLNAQLIGQSLKTIAPIVSTLDRIGTHTLNMMARLAHTLDIHQAISGTQEPVGSDFRTKGKDFSHLNFNVTFEVVDPAENNQAILIGSGLRRQRDISQRTFWEKYAKDVIEDPEEEVTRLMEEGVLETLVQSGMLTQIVLSQAVQEQLAEQTNATTEQEGGSGGTQNRQQETSGVEAQLRTSELEQMAQQQGIANVPREAAQFGFQSAAASSGMPQVGRPTP